MAPTILQILSAAVLAAAAVGSVNAESHTIKFDNQCGYGTPTLIVNGANQTLSNDQWTVTGGTASGIAYLQTGPCLYNGENCSLLEMTLGNSHCEGCGSSTDISLIPPHALNVPVSFSYYNGCDGQGATCNTADCSTAFFVPTDNQVQVACQTDDVNLLITFCGDASAPASASPPPASSSPAPASSKPAPASSKPAPASSSPAAVSSSSPAAASSTSPASVESTASTHSADVSTSSEAAPASVTTAILVASSAAPVLSVSTHSEPTVTLSTSVTVGLTVTLGTSTSVAPPVDPPAASAPTSTAAASAALPSKVCKKKAKGNQDIASTPVSSATAKPAKVCTKGAHRRQNARRLHD